jgi:hypothetical protein
LNWPKLGWPCADIAIRSKKVLIMAKKAVLFINFASISNSIFHSPLKPVDCLADITVAVNNVKKYALYGHHLGPTFAPAALAFGFIS